MLNKRILIPKIYPDVDYELVRSWFGGVSFETNSLSGYYWSCTENKIEGGARCIRTFPEHFHCGDKQLNATTVGTDSSYASVDDVVICKTDPFLGRNTAFVVPVHSSAGRSPFPISAFRTEASLYSVLPPTASPVIVSESPPPALPAFQAQSHGPLFPEKSSPSVLSSPAAATFPTMQPSSNPRTSTTATVAPVNLDTRSPYADSDPALIPEPSKDGGADDGALVTKLQLVDACTQISLKDNLFRTL